MALLFVQCACVTFLQPKHECTKIDYPKPDGVLSFDLLTNLARSGTAHEADQPAHLKLREWKQTTEVNLPVFDGPEGRSGARLPSCA